MFDLKWVCNSDGKFLFAYEDGETITYETDDNLISVTMENEGSCIGYAIPIDVAKQLGHWLLARSTCKRIETVDTTPLSKFRDDVIPPATEAQILNRDRFDHDW